MNLVTSRPTECVSAWEEFRRSGEWCATAVRPYTREDVLKHVAESIERSGLILVSIQPRSRA